MPRSTEGGRPESCRNLTEIGDSRLVPSNEDWQSRLVCGSSRGTKCSLRSVDS